MKKVLTILLALSLVMGLMVGNVGAVSEPNWDISGTWMLDFAGGTASRQFIDLVQDEYGNVTGEFWYNPGAWLYGGSLDGYVSGNDVYLFYERPSPLTYTGEFTGMINSTGMSGSFTDSNGGTYTWATAGEPICLLKAAPAVAVRLLKEAGIKHRYGDKKTGTDGNYIADVAHVMEEDGSFLGVSKCDVFDYELVIADFLNNLNSPAAVVVPENTLESVVLFDFDDDGAFGIVGDSVTITFKGSITQVGDIDARFTNVTYGIYSFGAKTDYVINDNVLVFTVNTDFSGPRLIAGEYQVSITGLEDIINNPVVVPVGGVAVTE